MHKKKDDLDEEDVEDEDEDEEEEEDDEEEDEDEEEVEDENEEEDEEGDEGEEEDEEVDEGKEEEEEIEEKDKFHNNTAKDKEIPCTIGALEQEKSVSNLAVSLTVRTRRPPNKLCL